MTLTFVLLGALALVAVAYLLGQTWGPRAGWVISAGLLTLAGVVAAIGSQHDFTAVTETHPWIPALGVDLRLRLDGLGFLFAMVVLIIGALIMAYAVYYLPAGRHGVFYGLLTFFAAAMLGLVLADDIVVMWVMWEFTTLCSFLLVQQSGPKGAGPAVRTLLVTGFGGVCLLAAVVLVSTQTGTTELSAALASPVWAERPGPAAVVAVLVAVAAFTKSAQFPFHGWLPDAMVASTPVSAYLHAAAMVKAGIYLLLRFSTGWHAVPTWNVMLVTIGLVTALMGAVYALQRHDLKELLAYSTVSQLGFLVAVIGIGNGYAIVGAVVHVVAHAVFKSGLFMSVGLIDHEAGTRDIRKLSGLRHTMPATSLVLVLTAASMAGLPPLFGFVSKEAMFKALSDNGAGPAVTSLLIVVAVAAATCTFAYSARMLRPLFGAAPKDPPHEAPALMIAPVAITALAGVVLGLVGPVLQPVIDRAASAILTGAPASDLSLWHGLNPALYMSVAVIVLGTLMVVVRRQVDALVVGRRLGIGRAVDVVEDLRSAAINFGARVGDLTRSDSPRRHLLVPVALVTVATAYAAQFGLPSLPTGTTTTLDWALFGIVCLGVVMVLIARSRVALVTTVGIVGFTTALYFFSLGAIDVALTQLLVEILTVVVMVLLLVRLPDLFHETGKARAIFAGVAAVVAGAVATVIALFVIGADDLSPVGRYYQENAYELTSGTNVVNTILVDFRAMDTLGEMVVLGVAALAMIVALQSRGLLPRTQSPVVIAADNPAADPQDNSVPIRMIDKIVGPMLFALSFWFFVRGHYQPGGGFIGALVSGAAIALIFLAAESDWIARLKVNYLRLIGVGIVVAVGTGLAGYLEGAFLRPLTTKVAGITLSSGLLFDVGVYLTVVGLVLATISRLGLDDPVKSPLRRPGEVTTRSSHAAPNLGRLSRSRRSSDSVQDNEAGKEN